MDRNSPYYKQVSLLIQALPSVAKQTCFALKGGTAINLFVNDFPRLSIDIDLVYLPLDARAEALQNMRHALGQITDTLNQHSNLNATLQNNHNDEMRIIVYSNDAQIKIEASPVARGTLLPTIEMDVTERVENEFGFASIHVVSMPDLYGGKLCAALDRQHPRDLFDVQYLIKTQGISRNIFDGFITYLLSHNRPISELLNPIWKDITDIYNNEFIGMTFQATSLDDLNNIRAILVSELKSHFIQRDYDFLSSFKQGKPNWSLAPNENIQNLPAVKWKLLNINKMKKDKHDASIKQLEEVMTHWL